MTKLLRRFTTALSIPLLVSSPAHACMSFIGTGADAKKYPTIKDEVAIIVWDQKNGVEHFIRQATFENAPPDFAFVIPVPSVPDFAEAPAIILDEIYGNLYRTAPTGEMFGSGEGSGKGRGLGGGQVEVVKQQDVAGLAATVVRSTDSQSLSKWLTDNGYKIPANADSWIKHYVDLRWNFVALKIKAKEWPASNAAPTSPWLRISFKTPRPFFPYKEADDRKTIDGREFSLFVIAPTKMSGSYESVKPWTTYHQFSRAMARNTKTEYKTLKNGRTWMGEVPSELEKLVNKLLDDPKGKQSLYITHFRNNEPRRPYAEDLVFDPVLK